jgi:hypothetical protein
MGLTMYGKIVSMREIHRELQRISIVAIITAVGVASLAAQEYRVPRGPDGKPDLNGIWQALNEANYDLEAHVARPAMALRPGPYGPVPASPTEALGAVGAVPPGLGVVEGGEIPYKAEALAIRKQNQQDWLNRDPEIKCYLPGVPRATYMPYPFQILRPASVNDAVFGTVRRLIDTGRIWVKMSGARMVSAIGPPSYADVTALAQAYVRAAPERMHARCAVAAAPSPDYGRAMRRAMLPDL